MRMLKMFRVGGFSTSFLVAVLFFAGLFYKPQAMAGKCPNVQVVVERSNSMGAILDLFTKLSSVQGTFRFGLPLYDYFHLGLTGFPRTSTGCDYDTAVLPDVSNAAKVSMALDAYMPTGSASTGTAIASVAALSAFKDASRPQFIILVTDGAPSCSGSSADTTAGTVDEIRKAYAQTPPIVTLVLGVGGALPTSDVDALNQMAVAGGRPLSGTTKYYAAPSGLDLLTQVPNVLGAINTEVGSCSDTPSDMGGPMDMSGPADMRGVDMAGPADMRGVDMAGQQDLSMPSDLSMPRDLSGPPIDLRDDDQGENPGNPAPVVDWIDPNKVPFGMGGTAEIVGRHFVATTPSSQIFLEGASLIALSNALVTDAFHISVSLPGDLPIGTYDVIVKNPDGQIGRQPGALSIVEKSKGCACDVGASSSSSSASAKSVLAALMLLLALAIRRRTRRAF